MLLNHPPRARTVALVFVALAAAGASAAGVAACAKAPDGTFDEPVRDAAASDDAPRVEPEEAATDAGAPPAHADAARAIEDARAEADVVAPPPDTGSGCASPCGLAPQCGCGAAATCDVVTPDGGVACVVAGTFGRGAGCTTTSACAPGLTCAHGTCHEFCAEADAGCANGGRCVRGRAGGSPPPNLLVCETGCDLADPATCGVGASGVINICVDDSDTGGTDCVGFPPANVGTAGGVCNATTMCPAAYVCTVTSQGAANGTCRKWCRVGGSECTGCVAFSNPSVAHNGNTYGYCP